MSRNLAIGAEHRTAILGVNGQGRFLQKCNFPLRIVAPPASNAAAFCNGASRSFIESHPPVHGNRPDSTTIYEGRIIGETMKGTAESEWSGNMDKRSFEARRVQK